MFLQPDPESNLNTWEQTLELKHTGSSSLHCLNSPQHQSSSYWSDPGRANHTNIGNLSHVGLNFKQSNYLEKKKNKRGVSLKNVDKKLYKL